MEVKFKNGDSVAIPDGCKAVVKDNVVIFEEIKQKFKRGDFLAYMYDHFKPSLFIYNNEYNCFCYVDLQQKNGEILFDIEFYPNSKIRFQTESEKQQLIEKLRENGKDWDEEKCEVVDYRWRAENGRNYFVVSTPRILEFIDVRCDADNDFYNSGNYFKTKELAEIALEKRNELFLTLKHS